MANMSYCRFQNTLKDLRECLEALEEGTDGLSQDELRAKVRLINLCEEIAQNHPVSDADREKAKLKK
jgi:hypothetical protein